MATYEENGHTTGGELGEVQYWSFSTEYAVDLCPVFKVK
jgi:hypothetical protein